MQNKYSNLTSFYFLIAIAVLISGYAFYILIRGFDPLFGIELVKPIWYEMPMFIRNNYATFSHVLGLSFFSYAIVGANRQYKFAIISFWILLNLVFELAQLVIFYTNSILRNLNGTFDTADLLAAIFAGIVFLFLTFLIEIKWLKFNTYTNKIATKIYPL